MRSLLDLLQDRFTFYGFAFLLVFLGIYNSLASAGLGLIGCGTLLHVIRSPRTVFRRDLIAPALFWGACVLATAFSPIPHESVPGLKKLAWAVLIVPGVACAFKTNERLRFISFLISGIIVLYIVDAVYQGLTGGDIFSARPVMRYETSAVARLTGPFLQAALLGLFLAVAVPLFESIRRSRSIRTGLMVLIAAAVLALGGTLTLGAWAGVLVAWIAMNIIDRRGSWVPVACLALPLAFAVIPNPLLSGLQETLYTNLANRLRMWEIAAGLWRERPLLGWGLNTFGVLYRNTASAGDPFFGLGTPHAHSMFVHLLVETGVLGLGAFLALLVSMGKRLVRSVRAGENPALALGLWGCLVAYLFHGLLESNLQTSQGNLLFWLIAGFAFLKLPLQKG